MSLSRNDKLLRRLLSRLADGELDDQGYAALQEHLQDDPDAAEQVAEFWAVHVALSARGAESLSEPEPVSVETPTASRSPLGIGGWFGMLAACFVAALGLALWQSSSMEDSGLDVPQEYVGLLTRTSNAVWEGEELAVPSRLALGQRLNLSEGMAEVTLNPGVVVTVRGPASLELTSEMEVRALRGVVRARVGPSAKGFKVETPTAGVVDLGTEFGVEVDDKGETDVVVFDGRVNLTYPRTGAGDGMAQQPRETSGLIAKTLAMGEGLRVDTAGIAKRIMSVDSQRFPVNLVPPTAGRNGPIIRSVSDNLRDSDSSMHYEIVAGGFTEDCRAYVDRFHEWNGVDGAGLPAELVGGDYVMTFNSDKWSSTIGIDVEIVRPARLYVLLDRRLPTPAWLSESFTDTGMAVGVDEGWWSPNGQRFELNEQGRLTPLGRAAWGSKTGDPPPLPGGVQPLQQHRCDNGPGLSIDKRYTVWMREVPHPDVIRLEGLGAQENRFSMYGIVATPL